MNTMFRGLVVVATFGILAWPAAAAAQSSGGASPTRIFGAYSFNTDTVAGVPFAIIVDQPVSPFFSHGGGPYGFEVSIERGLRGHLGVKASMSIYTDPFRGTASFCQTGSCAIRLDFEDDARAMYFVAGPSFTARERKRTALFAHALAGAVRPSSTSKVTGNSVQYLANPTSLPDTLILVTSTPFGQPSTLSYSDRLSD